ncbi:MAG TPA: hypothetical protein VMY76_15235 [Gemmatimonadales bacterium]|nr:hypothetical protein [Gemmatimonadales bacterium]
MISGRSLRLLFLALAVMAGLAEGTDHRSARNPSHSVVSTIGTRQQSLPAPVHDEATCAFCQAAIFPPCAPQPAQISVDELGVTRPEVPAPDARTPHGTANRPPSSRAPPTLRIV